MKTPLQSQPISDDVLREKYLKPGETGVSDLYARVAKALASVELEPNQKKYEALFLKNLYLGGKTLMVKLKKSMAANHHSYFEEFMM